MQHIIVDHVRHLPSRWSIGVIGLAGKEAMEITQNTEGRENERRKGT